MTLKETEDIIIRNEVLKNKPQKEQQEAINHKTALEHLFFVVKTNFNITGGYVFELHRMIMHGILKDAGKIRKTNVVIRGLAKKLPDHASVSRLMNEFIRDCKKKVDNYPANIAILHHDFEHMHPFTDGNGRVGRLIVITQLLSKGCAPCVIQNSHRREYYNALQMADMRDYKYIVQFVCEGILRGYGILQSNRLEHKKG